MVGGYQKITLDLEKASSEVSSKLDFATKPASEAGWAENSMVGKALDPEAVLSHLALSPYLRFRRGDHLYGRICEEGGFRCHVSFPDGVLSQEIADAVEFLIKYENDLLKLGSEPGVEKISLDFGYHLCIDGEKIIFQNDFLPPELLKRCGSLGIGIYLSLYPAPEDSPKT
jgi:hypothetical protein